MPTSTCFWKEGRTMLACVGKAGVLLLLGPDVARNCCFMAWESTQLGGIGCSFLYSVFMYLTYVRCIVRDAPKPPSGYCGGEQPLLSPATAESPGRSQVAPWPGEPGFRSSSCDSLVLGPGTSGSESSFLIGVAGWLCCLQAGGGGKMRWCL